ncbi:MAG: heavy-metal-associated domain-containing protein, partial [Sphingomonadaceae bacterium]|nr:heavy-metal-associated domain-containing protein [Sphingomonadaceae bacterium]
PHSYEDRNEWQRAWIRFQTGDSTIDYVRAATTAPAPMLLTVGQTGRPGRGWWRFLLDSYGAADVIAPMAYINYAYPGGPVTATFVAYHGPDRRKIGQVSLRIRNAANLPRLMDEGVRRMDALYQRALADGRLRADPSLQFEFGIDDEDIEEDFEELEESVAVTTQRNETATNDAQTAATGRYTIQVVTPNADAVRSSESAVRGTPGVRSASTSSLAIGGVSLMEVSYIGDLDTLAAALASRGFQVQRGAGTLRISRAAAPSPQQPPPANESGASEE